MNVRFKSLLIQQFPAALSTQKEVVPSLQEFIPGETNQLISSVNVEPGLVPQQPRHMLQQGITQ